MNVIKVKVNFSQRTIVRQGVDLTEGDYNSTKIVFDFDTDAGTKIFQMKNPSDEIVLEKEIINNEVILTGKADVTTIHNEKTYVKYLDDSSNVYWYNSDDEELYDSTWVLDTTTSLDTLTKQTEDASIFTETGSYIYEISLYNGDSRLTSASDKIKVKKKQIGDDSETAVIYKPVFDELISEFSEALEEIDNIDINASKSGDTATITITDKTGTPKTVQIKDGENGTDGIDGIDAKINGVNTISIEAGENITLDQEGNTLTISATGGGTSDYSDLTNKPSINSVTLSGNKTSSDLGVQPSTDNNLTTTNKTVTSAINEVNSIAKGANQALSYASYSAMVTAFNSLDGDEYNVGQNVYVITTEVPDLWVSSVESTSSTYTYVDDATIVSALQTNGYIQVGYYKLSMLETQKVDLTNYVTDTDYASVYKGGVIKANMNGFGVDSKGNVYPAVRDYTAYQSVSDKQFISKGTLENVIAGKGIVSNTDYATTNKGGVIKTQTYYGLQTTGTGDLQANVRTYEQYIGGNNNLLIGKGTLENVITGKNLINSTSLQNLCLDTNSPTPNFDNMTPIATYEYDISDKSYHPVYTLPNTGLSYSDTNIVVAYRITATGTDIYSSSDIIDVWHNPCSYPLTTVMHRTLSTSASTTGIQYLRAVYPTSTYLNDSNYPLGQEIVAYNATIRHIKIEVFKTPLNIIWKTSADRSIYINSTYNANNSITLYNVRGWIYRQPQSFVASSAGYANYIDSYECATIGSAAIKAGNEGLPSGHFAYLADDGLVYDIRNTTKNISPVFKKIGVLNNAVNKNTTITSAYFRTVMQLSTAWIGNIPHDTLSLGNRVFLRCTMDANGNIHSDNYLATSMGAGHTWLPFGVATASNAINMDTRNQNFYTLDSNGKLTHLDGIEIATGS